MSTCVEFFRDVLGVTLTTGQTAFVRVAVDGVAPTAIDDAEERDAAVEIFGAWSSCPPIARRTVNAACGRDSGKTHLGAGIALYKMLTVDVSRCGPGDVPRAIVVAPDLDTAKLTAERVTALVEAAPDLAALLVGAPTSDGFQLRRPDGHHVRFEVRAASRGGRSIRGRSIVVLILDEAALFFGDGYAVNDREIVKAARPRLLAGALVLLLSTPWAAEGLFFELHERNHGQPATAIAARASTLTMRDHDPELAEQVALEEAEDPDNAAREYGAEFLPSGSSQFFDGGAIAAAMALEWTLDASDCAKAAGADIGLTRDSSALAVVSRQASRYHLLEFMELRPERGAPLKLSRVVAEFARVLQRHSLALFFADAHVREPAREFAHALKLSILSAPEGAAAKFDSFVLVRKLLSEGMLRLPASSRLAAQLRAVRAMPMPGGTWKFSTPRSRALGHCDLMSALVVAVWGARRASDFALPTARRRTARPGSLVALVGRLPSLWSAPEGGIDDDGVFRQRRRRLTGGY